MGLESASGMGVGLERGERGDFGFGEIFYELVNTYYHDFLSYLHHASPPN